MRRLIPLFILPCLLALSSCGSFLTATTGDVAGIAGAGISAAVTKSPAVATGIGLGVGAAANAGLAYTERNVHHKEQQQIADTAGPLAVGQVATWSVRHRIPIEANEHGQVTVTAVTGGTGMVCKSVIFSVAEVKHGMPDPAFYTTDVCGHAGDWHWALAEPATERWGSLQ